MTPGRTPTARPSMPDAPPGITRRCTQWDGTLPRTHGGGGDDGWDGGGDHGGGGGGDGDPDRGNDGHGDDGPLCPPPGGGGSGPPSPPPPSGPFDPFYWNQFHEQQYVKIETLPSLENYKNW